MDTSRRATGFDLFKLGVAIVLLLLFLILLRGPASQPLATEPTASSANGVEPVTVSVTNAANPVAALATGTARPATSNPSPSPTATIEAAPTETPSLTTATLTTTPPPAATTRETVTSIVLPSPTLTPGIEFTLTPGPGTPSTGTACEVAAARSRLQAGETATILRRLNFRSSPGIDDNWLRTNLPGTQVEIIGGPECVPHVSGAYIWWQVRLPDGGVGWSAEGSVHGTFYFMEPE